MRNSSSNYSLQRDFQKLESRIDSIELRNKSGIRNNKKEETAYSRIDNKENYSIQTTKNQLFSYGAKYQHKLQMQKSKVEIPVIEVKRVDDKKKLNVIFKFYASFGDRTNIDYIRSNKIHKLMSDSQIKFQKQDQQYIDLLFVKANRNKPNMDFENFYYFLELLSETLYGDQNSFQILMDNHLTPLYENIISSTDLGDEETKLSQDIDPVCLKLIQVVIQPITFIYNKYFPPQFKNFNLKDQQEELMLKQQIRSSLFLFLKDFEICPQFITKGSAYLLLDYIQEDPNLPQIYQQKKQKSKFDINQFCCYIIKLAMMTLQSFDDSTQEQLMITPLQKLAFLFERMELSQGFNNLEIPSNNSKLNWKLKVPEELIELIISDPDAIQYLNSTTQRMKIHHLKNEEFYDEQVKRINTVPTNRVRPSIQINKQFEEQCQQLFQENYTQLFNIYRQYSGINQQTGQDNELVGSKWMKFLKDANLVNNNLIDKNSKLSYQVPHNEIDLIFTKACTISQNNRTSVPIKQKKQTMNFLQFLKGLQLLNNDIHVLRIILNDHVLHLMSQGPENKMKDLLSQLMNILKDKEIVEFLGLLHKSILVYYKQYTIGKQIMNFEQFLRFYKDFSIFPDLLTKNKIVQIFQILSKLYENQENSNIKSGHIDQHMFVESLALSALEITYNDDENLSQIEKIYFLIERLNQSEGPRIVQKQLGHTTCPSGQDWDLLYHIKKRFSWLIQQQQEQLSYQQ
ncbi:unnamed protein product [Paramecium primaurelia]|uniref:Uncharacterized protein n=1 Tax=Paramecium primaurelia TaxID=5886 RepID=A0A8S1NQH2_PARPR|nr:unnamed protein product [Paramecium primaurelia]